MDFDNIPDDVKERAKSCKSPEELLALAKEAGISLTDDQLEAISGGIGPGCQWDCLERCDCKRG
ncbi:MAG: hypothetical protein J6D34_04875 [Atopobiaceae bacterium]|nr:hypothetical protein [Atopobiaceae bacterium]